MSLGLKIEDLGFRVQGLGLKVNCRFQRLTHVLHSGRFMLQVEGSCHEWDGYGRVL